MAIKEQQSNYYAGKTELTRDKQSKYYLGDSNLIRKKTEYILFS